MTTPPPLDRVKGKAWILPVGNELLIGRITDTNSSWLARRLTFLGFTVTRIVKVPDDIEDVAEELRRAIMNAEIIITTGGLGPTYDDRTLEGVARALGVELELNEEAKKMVEEFYSRRGLALTRERVKMAMLPSGARPIPNPVGAAPGSLIEYQGRLIISLPGVPDEMKRMFDEFVKPFLEKIAPQRELHECKLVISGVPESSLAPLLEEIARRHPRAYIKSHPKGHEIYGPIIEIRILAVGNTTEDAVSEAEEVIRELQGLSGIHPHSIREKDCRTPD